MSLKQFITFSLANRIKTLSGSLVIATVLVVGFSCVPPHVQLEMPPHATQTQRIEAYESLKTEHINRQISAAPVAGGGVLVQEGVTHALLSNGTTVYHAEDLESLVPASSSAGFAIRKLKRAKKPSMCSERLLSAP